MKKLMFFWVIVFVIPFVMAQLDIGSSDGTLDKVINLQTPDAPPFNNNTGFVNSSNFWDFLDTPDDIPGSEFWYNHTSDTLAIANTLFLRLDGTLPMLGNLNMNSFNLTNINELQAPDGSAIKFGDSGIFFDVSQAINIQSNQILADGEISHMFTDLQGQKIIELWQVGLNNSGGFHRNSYIISSDLGETNGTVLSNCITMASLNNGTARIGCDSSDTGADLLVQDDIQALGTMFADDGIRAENLATFLMNGNNFQISNGSLHISTPVEFTAGFLLGEEVVKVNEGFSGSLGTFTNLQVDIGNWISTTDALCDEGDCVNANGVSGNGNIIMETNISTTDINNTVMSFVYSLTNMLGANSFTVTVNNNVGSGEVTLLTDSTNDVALSSQVISMPSTMWNQGNVRIRVYCDVTVFNRECFVDSVRINGTAMSDTSIQVMGFDSEICFSDATRGSDGVCNVGAFYNASLNTVFTKGLWNISQLAGGGGVTDHSALTNLEFSTSGHTFVAAGQTLDVGSYDINTTGNIQGSDVFALDDLIAGDNIVAKDNLRAFDNITAGNGILSTNFVWVGDDPFSFGQFQSTLDDIPGQYIDVSTDGPADASVVIQSSNGGQLYLVHPGFNPEDERTFRMQNNDGTVRFDRLDRNLASTTMMTLDLADSEAVFNGKIVLSDTEDFEIDTVITTENTMTFQGMEQSVNTRFGFFGDSTGDNHVFLDVYGIGSPLSLGNNEKITIGYASGGSPFFRFRSGSFGSGTTRKLVIDADGSSDQLVIETNGDVSMDNGNLLLTSDNIKLIIGAGGDLEFFHDGTNSQIFNNNGDLVINNTLGSGVTKFGTSISLTPIDTAPFTCDASTLGSLYFDISEDQTCTCTSGGWKETDEQSATCT